MKKILILTIILLPSFISSQWFIVNHISNYQFYSLYFTSNTVGCVGGNQNGVIFKTTDSGSNFTSVPTGTSIWFLDIFFLNQQTGYACGQNGYIVKTTNSGSSWNVVYQAANFMHSIRFVDQNTGYAVGFTYVYKTVNAGLTWNAMPNNYSNYLLGTSFVNTNTGYICGDGGLIAKTTDGGFSWQTIMNGGSDYFEEIVMTNTLTGYAAGKYGRILKTTNGGTNWFAQNTTTNDWLLDLYFINSNSGWACGMNGRIVYTVNGGETWTTQYVPTISTIRQIHFVTPDTGYAVTDNGMILKTYNAGNPTGITQINSELPSKYSLKQNYPNPFNPSTKINFSIPKSGFVSLLIYDNLGKELTTIINQVINSGNYEVNFDSGNLGSGVYYYRLITEDFTETKKMIILK
ncbi:MAG: hemagluttinin repeat-containing protein [Chlorobi bacterium OLB5]|nr:MAG: hemagluttinin repeat-containing protein [Chlorobi bacterium OLB5]